MFNADKYFKHLVPICHLSDKNKKIISDNAKVVEVKQGDYLFKQGDNDNNSYYLIDGSVELRGMTNTFVVSSGSDNANYVLAQFQPRQYSALILQNAKFLSIDRNLLDMLAEKDGQYHLEISEGMLVSQVDEDETGDWMTRILQSDLFNKLSASNIQKVFARIESIRVEKGDVIINQDDVGDYFYIIEIGRAEVLRRPSEHAHPVKLNDLSVGDYFGEEALISNCPRNANVVMLTDGELMRLHKNYFIELIRNTILVEFKPDEIETLKKESFIWVDVRFPDECLENKEFDRLSIPLNLIRMSIEQLDLSKKYIICCEDGKKSAVAAFLLAQKGFDSGYVRGGLENCRNRSSNGLRLDFLHEQTNKKKSSIIEFIPRGTLKKARASVDIIEPEISGSEVQVEEIKNDNQEENKQIKKNLSNEETKLNEAARDESLKEMRLETINPVIKDTQEEVIITKDKQSLDNKTTKEDTKSGDETIDEAEVSSVDEDNSNTGNINNTDAVKELLDQYRLEQDKALEDIRTNAEKRINKELTRIKDLYDEKEKEISDLKKLKEEVARKLVNINTPVLTEQVKNEDGVENSHADKQEKTQQINEAEENKSENIKEKTEQTKIQKDVLKNNQKVSKILESKREILSKRHKILNDPRFRNHIRALNVKVDQEFQRDIKAYKTELDEEVSGLVEMKDTSKETLPEQHLKIKNDRPIEAKSDATIENDILGWIHEQELFENDPERLEMIRKKKEFTRRIIQDFDKNKRLNKIHDRSLISEIRLSLKEKE